MGITRSGVCRLHSDAISLLRIELQAHIFQIPFLG